MHVKAHGVDGANRVFAPAIVDAEVLDFKHEITRWPFLCRLHRRHRVA
jgi:hypothetical protein